MEKKKKEKELIHYVVQHIIQVFEELTHNIQVVLCQNTGPAVNGFP